MKILKETTYHEGNRYYGDLLQTNAVSNLPNNYFGALVQLNSPKRRFNKDPVLKEHCSNIKTISRKFTRVTCLELRLQSGTPREM